MGKGAALPHAADQVKNGFGTAAEIVTALCEKPDGAPILQVCSKAGGAVQVDHDLSVGIVKRNDPKALACQCAIQFPQIITEGIPVFQFTGEYITGLQSGQGRGTVTCQYFFGEHGHACTSRTFFNAAMELEWERTTRVSSGALLRAVFTIL